MHEYISRGLLPKTLMSSSEEIVFWDGKLRSLWSKDLPLILFPKSISSQLDFIRLCVHSQLQKKRTFTSYGIKWCHETEIWLASNVVICNQTLSYDISISAPGSFPIQSVTQLKRRMNI